MKRFYTVKQLIKEYSIKKYTVKEWLRYNRWDIEDTVTRLGNRILFDADLFEKWLEKREKYRSR